MTQILQAIGSGRDRSAGELLPLVYDELRKLAQCRLSNESSEQTLQATALVHEAYLRLVGTGDPGWSGRGHFFAAAAEAMRRILIENARQRDHGDLARGRVPQPEIRAHGFAMAWRNKRAARESA